MYAFIFIYLFIFFLIFERGGGERLEIRCVLILEKGNNPFVCVIRHYINQINQLHLTPFISFLAYILFLSPHSFRSRFSLLFFCLSDPPPPPPPPPPSTPFFLFLSLSFQIFNTSYFLREPEPACLSVLIYLLFVPLPVCKLSAYCRWILF